MGFNLYCDQYVLARMKLKGNPILPRPAASQDNVTDNFECVHFIDVFRWGN